MIITRTPHRLSFFGGGSDYEQFFLRHQGAVLAGSIDKYVYVCLHNGQISHFSDLPTKCGMASSSAYTVGLLRACSNSTPIEISRMATTLEIEKTGGNVGYQDQYLCAVGGFHHLKFSEQGIRDFPIDKKLVAPLEEWLMLFDTHQYRRNGDIIPSQLREMEQHEKSYERMAEMAWHGIDRINNKEWSEFGLLLDEAWNLKKQVAPMATTAEIDSIYNIAIKAGAIGGKLLGGGGGGFIVFVVEPEKQVSVKQALSDLTYVPFHFENEGSNVIYRDD